MYCRLLALIASCCATVALSGCGTLRHNNVMLFGTDTNFGLSAGVNATNVPQVNIGYRRQEAVVMPLLANVSTSQGQLVPCTVTPGAGQDCKFIARYGEQAQDSYSVLASFGAKFDTRSGNNAPTASGGLAQYFATGVAAQILALKGGAALVSTGEAAEESAKADVSGALATLVHSPEVDLATTTIVRRWNTRRAELTTKLLAKNDDELLAHVRRLSAAAFPRSTAPNDRFIEDRCRQLPSIRACIEQVQAGRILGGDIVDTLYEADARLSAEAQ